MKKILFLLLLLIVGMGIGSGAAFAVGKILGTLPTQEVHEQAQQNPVETTFIPAGTILAPIIAEDGNLSGYANFEVQLEVPADMADEVTARLPLLLHAINLKAWQTPMATGPQHALPDLRIFSIMVQDAASQSLGKGAVVRAVVMSARPV